MSSDVSRDVQRLVDAVVSGNRRALAKCCSLAESVRPADQELFAGILSALPSSTKPTRRIAITGAPGVGKSSIIERWGTSLISQGHTVAVLAIDPSSRRTGGSILGDKTRMKSVANSTFAFVRPQPAGRHLGGTARATRLCIPLCEAAGYDTIIVETVGVGQSEVEVADMVDLCLLMVLPTAGDDVQAIKRGIMEIADVIAITKSDINPSASRRAAAILTGTIRMLRPTSANWVSTVVLASAMDEDGLAEIEQCVSEFFSPDRRATILQRRSHQLLQWFDGDVATMMQQVLLNDNRLREVIDRMREAIVAGTISVPHASSVVLRVIHDVLQARIC